MADILKDSFNEASLHVKVLFQKGRDVTDFELNELQDLQRVALYRTIQSMLNSDEADLVGFEYKAVAKGQGFLLTASGSPILGVKAGYILCGGYLVYLDADTTYTPTAYAGTPRTDAIYLQITESEIADPEQLAELGETTKRRKLTASLHTSITGVVPANTGDPPWKGGTWNFLIGTIARSASNISTVVDARYPSVGFILDSIVSYDYESTGNYGVRAIGAPVITNGVRGPTNPGPSLSFVVDPFSAFDLTADELRFNFCYHNTSSVMARIGAIPEAVAYLGGDYTGVALNGTESFFANYTSILKFWDVNTANHFVPLTGGDAWSNFLTLCGVECNTAVGKDISLVHKYNAVVEITVGDGSSSFGDFNGATAIKDALEFVCGPDFPVTAVTIRVKPGSYTWANGASTFDLSANMQVNISIIGEGTGGECQLTFSGTAPLWSTVEGQKLVLKNMSISGTAGVRFIISSGTLELDNCKINSPLRLASAIGIPHSGGTPPASSYEFTHEPVLVAKNTNFYTSSILTPTISLFTAGSGTASTVVDCGDVIIENCQFFAASAARIPSIYCESSSGGSTGAQSYRLFVRRTNFYVAPSNFSAGDFTNFAGVFYALPTYGNASDTGLVLREVLFEDCFIKANVAGSSSTCNSFFYVRPRTSTTGVRVDSFTLRRVAMELPVPSHTTHLVPFVVMHETGADTIASTPTYYPVTRLSLEDVSLDYVGSFSTGYGIPPAELNLTTGVADKAYGAAMILTAESIRIRQLSLFGKADNSNGYSPGCALSGVGDLSILWPTELDAKNIQIGPTGVGADSTNINTGTMTAPAFRMMVAMAKINNTGSARKRRMRSLKGLTITRKHSSSNTWAKASGIDGSCLLVRPYGWLQLEDLDLTCTNAGISAAQVSPMWELAQAGSENYGLRILNSKFGGFVHNDVSGDSNAPYFRECLMEGCVLEDALYINTGRDTGNPYQLGGFTFANNEFQSTFDILLGSAMNVNTPLIMTGNRCIGAARLRSGTTLGYNFYGRIDGNWFSAGFRADKNNGTSLSGGGLTNLGNEPLDGVYTKISGLQVDWISGDYMIHNYGILTTP